MAQPKKVPTKETQTKIRASKAKNIDIEESIKKVSNPVFGWAIEDSRIIPIFGYESKIYKGKIYESISLAAEARDSKKNNMKILSKKVDIF